MNTSTTSAQIERYQRLIAISRDLASTLDLDLLLERIVNAAAELTDAEEASILLYDDRASKLYFQAATNLNPRLRGLEIPAEKSLAGWIIQTGEPVRVADAQRDERHFAPIKHAAGITTHTLLGVPLRARQGIIGVLEAINKRQGEFNLDDQEILTTLGAHAAIAIENSRLFQQSDLIAEFIHEIRTPLAALQTAVHLLQRHQMEAERFDYFTKQMQKEIQRLVSLSNSFLDLARLESGRAQLTLSEFDLSVTLRECFDLMEPQATEQSLHCELALPETAVVIYGDQEKIKRAVLNLLSNAIKYNRPNGLIRLALEEQPDTVCIAVSDTGIGISPKYIPHVTNKFFRVPQSEHQAEGAGLGLAIVQRIIGAHGGKMEIQSKEGEGSTFLIYLPRR